MPSSTTPCRPCPLRRRSDHDLPGQALKRTPAHLVHDRRTSEAQRINYHLAEGAQAAGIAMGPRSVRAAIENPALAGTFRVRHLAPDILLFANLGAAQLNAGFGLDQCRRAVDLLEADALIFHLNPLQEALQVDGNTDWRGLLARIETVCHGLGLPVIAKEVGWGISAEVARQLVDAGVTAIDVAGSGGTSWSQVEMYRAPPKSAVACAPRSPAGASHRRGARRGSRCPAQVPLIASGGLRSGMDLAKVLALGADLVGWPGPFLKAADVSAQAVAGLVAEMADVLRIVLFCLGIANVQALKARLPCGGSGRRVYHEPGQRVTAAPAPCRSDLRHCSPPTPRSGSLLWHDALPPGLG